MEGYVVRLNEEERATLLQIISKGKAAASKIKRANILLMSDVNHEKHSNSEIAKLLHVHSNTVINTKKQYVFEGFESAINPKKCPKRPHKKIMDGEKEAHLIALCCSESPEGYNRWSLRLLAEKVVELEICEKVSHETIRQTLKKINLSLT